MQTELDRQVTTLLEETLRICEGAAVAVALVVGGEKISSPLVTGLGYGVSVLVCFYLGVRVDRLVAYAQFRNGPRRFNWRQTVYGAVCGASFAFALVHAADGLRAVM